MPIYFYLVESLSLFIQLRDAKKIVEDGAEEIPCDIPPFLIEEREKTNANPKEKSPS